MQNPAAYDLSADNPSAATAALLEAFQSGEEQPLPKCPPLVAAFAVLEGALGLKQRAWLDARQQQNWQGCVSFVLGNGGQSRGQHM